MMPEAPAPDPTIPDTYGTLHLRAGESLFEEGSIGRAAYIIEAGEIEIYVERDGRNLSLARRGPGELFGEIAAIDRGPRSASARAATDCRIIVIQAEQLEGRATASDPVLRMCLGIVVTRYRHAMAQLAAVPADARPPGASLLAAENTTVATGVETLRAERDLARGLRDNELVLFFQPIVRLANRKLVGFEALMRWRHPTRGLVPPASFIPVAEAGGLIVDLTRWALGQLGAILPDMVAAERYNPEGTERLFMTVNVSAADLLQPAFSRTVCDMLRAACIEASRLKIEITESMIMTDVEKAAVALRVFEGEGIGVAIDDFGTGYSSLGSLATLPISTLKIDRSFVQSMLTDPVQHRIVSTILRLAGELDVPVVAEGVEGEAQAAALAAMGCQYAQGYLFGRPEPIGAMVASVRSWRPLAAPAAIEA